MYHVGKQGHGTKTGKMENESSDGIGSQLNIYIPGERNYWGDLLSRWLYTAPRKSVGKGVKLLWLKMVVSRAYRQS